VLPSALDVAPSKQNTLPSARNTSTAKHRDLKTTPFLLFIAAKGIIISFRGMKRVFLIILICLSKSIYAQEIKIDTIVGDKKHFIPLDTCYYNVYNIMGGFKNNKIQGTDTMFITKKPDWNGYSSYAFSNFGDFLVRNDSLLQPDMHSVILYYWPVKKIEEKRVAIGGDGCCATHTSEPIGYYKIGNRVYANCYKFSIQMEFNFQVIIAYGIGVISMSDRHGDKVLSSIALKKNCRK
jgi:hypothetical protein